MDARQREELARIGGKGIRFDCPMDRYTTFRVGGKVEALYSAQGLSALRRMISFLDEEKIPYLAVGKGSNLLVKNGGFKGTVILLRRKLAAIEKNKRDNQIIFAGGGASIVELLTYCKLEGLGGLEFLSGIPGTVGGAVAMNAGAFGKEIGSMVREIQMVTQKGELITADRSRLNFFYRGLSIQKGSVIVKVSFQLCHESPEAIAEKSADYLAKRKAEQPLEYPSGGSVFKNPPNDYAGRLIEKAGLKGERIGGAMISPKHANWIVNTGGAKAGDILALMDMAREKVREETGILLEPEIRVVGV